MHASTDTSGPLTQRWIYSNVNKCRIGCRLRGLVLFVATEARGSPPNVAVHLDHVKPALRSTQVRVVVQIGLRSGDLKRGIDFTDQQTLANHRRERFKRTNSGPCSTKNLRESIALT